MSQRCIFHGPFISSVVNNTMCFRQEGLFNRVPRQCLNDSGVFGKWWCNAQKLLPELSAVRKSRELFIVLGVQKFGVIISSGKVGYSTAQKWQQMNCFSCIESNRWVSPWVLFKNWGKLISDWGFVEREFTSWRNETFSYVAGALSLRTRYCSNWRQFV